MSDKEQRNIFMASTAEFIDTFKPPVTLEFWQKLHDEEAEEVIDAFAHLVKECADLIYVSAGYGHAEGPDREDTIKNTDKNGFASHIVMLVGEHFGEAFIESVFAEVHRSNMSKLAADGTVLRREDGKVLKGPNYSPANTRNIVDLLYNKAETDAIN